MLAFLAPIGPKAKAKDDFFGGVVLVCITLTTSQPHPAVLAAHSVLDANGGIQLWFLIFWKLA
jgi:hypothetical protein